MLTVSKHDNGIDIACPFPHFNVPIASKRSFLSDFTTPLNAASLAVREEGGVARRVCGNLVIVQQYL